MSVFFFPNRALGSAIRVMGIIKITHTFTNPICSSKFQLRHRFNEHGKCGYMVAPRCSSLCAQEKCHIGNERFTLGFRGNKFFQLTAS